MITAACYGLVDDGGTGLGILREFFLGQLGDSVGVKGVPERSALYSLSLWHSDRLNTGYGDAADDGLAGFDFREGNAQATVFCFSIDNAFQGTTVSSLSPGVEIVDDDAVVDGDIEDAQTFVIILFTAPLAVPGFGEVEFDAVSVGGGTTNLEVIPQSVTAKAEELEELVALSATDVGGDMALGSLKSVDAWEVLTPRMANEAVISLPELAVLVFEGIATTVDAV